MGKVQPQEIHPIHRSNGKRPPSPFIKEATFEIQTLDYFYNLTSNLSSHVRLFSISCLWDMSFSCHFADIFYDIFMSFPWGMSEGKSSSFPSWKWCKIVQTRPSVIFSFPSTISSTWIFTNSTFTGSFLGLIGSGWIRLGLVSVLLRSGFSLVWES